MHDNTLTDDNREKFIQIAERYNQRLKFYNVEELCADRIAEIVKYLPQAKRSIYTIAMFYRLFIPYLLLPQGIEKAFYLDSDIIVNCDITEFWQIDLGDKPFGAVSRTSQIKDKKNDDTSKVFALVREGIVNAEDYFFSGGLLMNLKVLREKENTILEGLKFIGNNPQYVYLDQDVLNYCFSTSYVKLPVSFNRVMLFVRPENEWTIEKKIYHYAANRITLGMDMNDPYNRLWMDYFIKTPWVDDDVKAVLSGDKLPSRKNFAVSVVIPIYNAEEFINECLDSLLIQTFQDFEVIVVDDCSTDSSYAIVKEYAPKFNGRLRLEQTEKNSGGGGYIPRNIGLMLARGEYIQFLDADDMLLPTALESLYLAANLYDAEVVYTSSYYRLNAPNDVYLYKDGTTKKMPIVQTEFTIDDPDKNLSRLCLESGEGNFHNCWTKFVRRDFILRNRILFSIIPNAGDLIWVINFYCRAKRFLRISTPFYFYRRYNSHSIIRTVRSPQEQCSYWFSSFVEFVKVLHELEKTNEVLAENPLYCLMIIKKHFSHCLYRTEDARKELDSEEIYKILHSEFIKSTDNLVLLLPFFCSLIDEEKRINANQSKLIKHYAEPINKFKLYLSAKIYVLINKKMDEEAIQILSVSDEKAKLSKPPWWQRTGTCHMIDSYAGKLEIVAKAIVEGNVQIRLAGSYAPNPADKSKRIPYWIDYTKLTVNENTIFDTITPAWHDKPYVYKMDVKADEEIKIHVEWLPHRSDTIETQPPKITAPEQKISTPSSDTVKPKVEPPPKVPAPAQKISTPSSNAVKPKVEPELKYETARVDVKFMSRTAGGDCKILSLSDKNASVSQPGWLQKGGIGYQIQSDAGKLEFIAKITADGQLNCNLKGIAVANPNNPAIRIPYWVIYTKLVMNERTIFNTIVPAWNDRPFRHSMDVKAGDEIKIQIEWQPQS